MFAYQPLLYVAVTADADADADADGGGSGGSGGGGGGGSGGDGNGGNGGGGGWSFPFLLIRRWSNHIVLYASSNVVKTKRKEKSCGSVDKRGAAHTVPYRTISYRTVPYRRKITFTLYLRFKSTQTRTRSAYRAISHARISENPEDKINGLHAYLCVFVDVDVRVSFV
ncbi:hypothetical protein V1477_004866 [Vespula maculifrons]|uniref:Uncharacterized protein n=1 Tax=Vespula maculifrons TaxID=7453 RepID=A0ABD2CN41_VESMC